MASVRSGAECHCLNNLLVLAALGCAVCEAAGRVLLAGPHPGNLSFPYWKYSCNDPCSCSPYVLQYSTNAVPTAAPGVKKTCFEVTYIGCNSSMPCCAALLKSVSQIALQIGSTCLKPSLLQVEVSGKNWTSWETKTHKTVNGTGYSLRIYNMKFNGTTFPGSQVCLTAKESCDFVKQCASSPKTCRFAVSESTAIKTCTLCPVVKKSAPKPLPKTCQLCEVVSVQSPLDVPFLNCTEVGELMVDNLTTAVIQSNGKIVKNFTYSCPNSTYIKACGEIESSDVVEAAVQARTEDLLMQTSLYTVYREFCAEIDKFVDISVSGTCAVGSSRPFISIQCDFWGPTPTHEEGSEGSGVNNEGV